VVFIYKKENVKQEKGEQKIKLWGDGAGLSVPKLTLFGCCLFSGVRGGGKCPEEEHTTCSGGPTIIIVTSAVYGERDFIL
jgi:hypothetical protein